MKSKALLGLMLVTSNTLFAAPQYTMVPLGTLGGDESYASDINDNGDVVGSSKSNQGINHAFVSSVIDGNRVIIDLGVPQEGASSIANAINNNGQIVGSFKTSTESKPQAFVSEKLDTAWIMTKLIDGTSNAKDINDSGEITGSIDLSPASSPEKARVFIASKINNNWSVSSLFTELSTPSGSHFPGVLGPHLGSTGNAISNSGQIAAITSTSSSWRTASHSVYYAENAWHASNIGELGGSSITEGGFITKINRFNNLDQMIGSSKAPRGAHQHDVMHAIIATEKENGWVLSDLGSINNHNTHGMDINDAGVVVGYFVDSSGSVEYEPFIYIDEKLQLLTDLITPDGRWTKLTKAIGINNTGQIVGEGIYDGKRMAFLLTPNKKSIAACAIGLDPKVIEIGEGTALWWWTENASTANINSGIGNIQLPSYYQWIYPTESTSYKMTITGSDGLTTQCKADVIVTGSCEMGADPQTISAGEGSALWWWTTDNIVEASIVGDQYWAPLSLPSNYHWLTPTETTTYKMKAKTAGGITTICETTIIVE